MKKILCVALLATNFTCGWAWSKVGHLVVAQIAYEQLTKKARKEVDDILGKRGMIYEAIWADEIKSDTIYPQSHVWHYQNLKGGLSKEEIEALYHNKKAQGEHMLYALDSLRNALQQDKRDATLLKFVVHLTGDFYCPLHVAHPDDKGGNKAQMRWFGKGTNLHTVWDRWLIDYRELSFSEYATYLIGQMVNEKEKIQKESEVELFYKTYQRQQDIYTTYENKTFDNSYRYAYHYLPVVDTCLYTAGVRLAQTLNAIYK